MAEKVIEVCNLTKDYGEGRGIFDISLEVNKGEVFGFVGTNGSGKTTTIRNMMGFIKADEGSSSVLGMDSWSKAAQIMERVSYVPGEIAFPALATGIEFLKAQAEYFGVKDFTYMNYLIEKLQLDPSAKLKRMSKGMKQKTALVAALMGEKEILVLDEPTTGLDPLMRDAFLDLMREEREKGHTIFMSSHIFEEMEAICDRVAMIKDGKLIGTTALYELRHPDTKEFILKFEDKEEYNSFVANKTYEITTIADNKCSVRLHIEDINSFFAELTGKKILYLQEEHMSLQKEFMKVYKGGKSHGGK